MHLLGEGATLTILAEAGQYYSPAFSKVGGEAYLTWAKLAPANPIGRRRGSVWPSGIVAFGVIRLLLPFYSPPNFERSLF
jgi:hypothetical protein